MDTEILAQLIDAKHSLLVQLRQLAARQMELINSGDLSRLMSFLAVKQQLLESVHELERRLDPFRDVDPEHRSWPSPAHRQRARETATHCNALLSEIMAAERGCEMQLLHRRDRAAEQLQQAHVTTQVTNAYLSPGQESGQRFDASCET